MEVVFREFQGNSNYFVEVAKDKDLCFTCGNHTKCPLVEALAAQVIVLRTGYLALKKCKMYTKERFNLFEKFRKTERAYIGSEEIEF